MWPQYGLSNAILAFNIKLAVRKKGTAQRKLVPRDYFNEGLALCGQFLSVFTHFFARLIPRSTLRPCGDFVL